MSVTMVAGLVGGIAGAAAAGSAAAMNDAPATARTIAT
jgi:hypothetical protein